MQPNWEKLKSLVHYVCEKAENPSVLGSIKLNKVLWYSDVINYLNYGNSITLETYVKRQHGPVPKHILSIIQNLIIEQKIIRSRVDHFGYIKNEYIALQVADKNIFSGEEMAVINDSFEYVCLGHTAKSISEETHGTIWQIAQMGEVIPYESVFASIVGEVNEEDIEWAHHQLSKAA